MILAHVRGELGFVVGAYCGGVVEVCDAFFETGPNFFDFVLTSEDVDTAEGHDF